MGGGRRPLRQNDPGLVPALKRLVNPATLGDPMRPLICVSKSMEKLAATLTQMGHPISADTVCTELVKLGFSRQSNRKADEGSKHPDRNAQFEYINAKVVAAQAQQQPVISVDTKKKELVGNFKNGRTDCRPKGDPQRVNVHDFEDKKLGKVVPPENATVPVCLAFHAGDSDNTHSPEESSFVDQARLLVDMPPLAQY